MLRGVDTMEILNILTGILCFSGFSFIAKKSQLDGCNIFSFTASLYFTGFVLCFIKTMPGINYTETPSILIVLSIAAGIASAGGFLFQLASLRSGGKLALLIIISNMSTLILIAYSVIIFKESISLTKITGIILFVIFLFILNSAMRENSV